MIKELLDDSRNTNLLTRKGGRSKPLKKELSQMRAVLNISIGNNGIDERLSKIYVVRSTVQQLVGLAPNRCQIVKHEILAIQTS